MTIYEALAAWQAGDITARRGMTLTGAADVLELYALSELNGVATRLRLLDREQHIVRILMEAVHKKDRFS
jgi:hypothetical protein